MNNVNQKIIQAVIDKANRICPDSLALIGIYGSADTEDEYDKSDLDLLILIENDEGWKLGTGFILEDSKVGYDIYCTTRSGLRYDAECHHARLSRLMDSRIVYVKNQDAYSLLMTYRAQAEQLLNSEERFQRVYELVDKAKIAYANACLREGLGQVRMEAYGVISYVCDAVMLYHGEYFRRGVKRTFEELSALPIDSVFVQLIRKVTVCKDISQLRDLLKHLILYAESHIKKEKQKTKPSESLSGTCEEMYSNWRNKVEEAVKNDDAFASFMNMCSFQLMLSEIAQETEIGSFPVMDEYNPDSLEDNVIIFDKYLQKYEQVCIQAGISVKRYPNVEEFVADYLCQQKAACSHNSDLPEEKMYKYEIVDLPRIAVIGKQGFCTKEKNVVQNLWEQARLHFCDVADIGMKNDDGSYAGFWGVMSDETMSFMPWTDNFSRGFYLAGIEVYEDTAVPDGWTKWVMPARKYLVTEVDPDSYEETFRNVISCLIPQLGMKLAGAVCDFTEPATGQNKLFFPVA